MSTVIAPLAAEDHADWLGLARGYKDFYQTPVPPAGYELTWQRLQRRDGVYGLGAKVYGQLVGIAHYLFHTSVWSPKVCYLEDLFVQPAARGHGVARALIEAVAAEARAAEATRFYWSTHESNATARLLYDKVGRHAGFIRYDHPLRRPG